MMVIKLIWSLLILGELEILVFFLTRGPTLTGCFLARDMKRTRKRANNSAIASI